MKEVWQVHVFGPDDILDADNEIDALRKANDINLCMANITERKVYDPIVIAVAEKLELPTQKVD